MQVTMAQLNLARKWRSKQFNQIIGQELSVRLIKNGLYRNLIFPVYLLSGTRGCGKTTMGRLFAAALNCDQLIAFQKNPQHVELPCLQCMSCKSMQTGAHPDFIELDAASHTGVDNIRQLIEGASFSPVMGAKKIYLIDEAHMLSKAAFNALLKVLEEPPVGVVFLLATTDPHKIIDTVRSRCFQLFFNPLGTQELIKHLTHICDQENISYESNALALIVHETEGSVRDAINLLERVRLVQNKITQESVVQTLGFCTEEKIIDVFEAVLIGNAVQVLTLIEQYKLVQFDISLLWKKLVELIRLSLWLYFGVLPDNSFLSIDRIRSLLAKTSYEHLVMLLEICYEHELAFSKTSLPHVMFEMLLLKLVGASSAKATQHMSARADTKLVSMPASTQVLTQPIKQGPWSEFLGLIDTLQDPLISSIFKQARFALSEDQKEVQLTFAQDVTFFKDWLDSAEKSWKQLLKKVFGPGTTCTLQFTDAAQVQMQRIKSAPVVSDVSQSKPVSIAQKAIAYPKQQREISIDIKDTTRWEKAQMVLKVFPGTITQII